MRARAFKLALVASLGLVAAGCRGQETGPGNHVQGARLEDYVIAIPEPPEVFDVPTARPAANPRNLILISLDTLRADHLGTYGYARSTSPTIDELAAQGVVFEQAGSHAPRTAPSHMSLFTGLYPDVHGVMNLDDSELRRLSDEIPTLATLLRRAGYRTEAYVGGGNIRSTLGFDQGFDSYSMLGAEAVRVFENSSRALEQLAAGTGEDGSRAPFFLFVHTHEIHAPYVGPDSHWSRFTDASYSGNMIGSRAQLEELVGKNWPRQHKEYWNRVDRQDAADIQNLKDLYDAGISYTDDELKKFLTRVQRLGLDDNTLVVLLSDHGEEFLEHGGITHRNVYQEQIHVPLIFRFPRNEGMRGIRVPETVRLIDVTPTILEYLKLPVPDYMQGASLLAMIQRQDVQPRPVLSQWRAKGFHSLRIGDWKVIVREEQGEVSLYNLALDPAEAQDRAPEQPELLAVVQSQLRRLRSNSQQLRSLVARGEKVDIDEPTRQELEALGYVVR